MRTRKKSQKTKHSSSTIEGLHSSFDLINDKAKRSIQEGKNINEIVACIRKAWDEQFHSILDDDSLVGLAQHYTVIYSKGHIDKTRKRNKGQRGGYSSLVGGMAPIGLDMGQGTTSSTFGQFPTGFSESPAMVQSLDLGRFYESNVSRACNSTGGHSHMSGGALWDAILNGAPIRSVPPNTVEKVTDAITATPNTVAYSSPVTGQIPHVANFPQPFDSSGIHSIGNLASISK